MTEIGPLQQGERKLATFDFVTEMGEGLVIVDVTFTCAVWRGVDPSPNDLLDGPPIKSGQKAFQWVKGGVIGNIYLIKGEATDDEGGVHIVEAKLRIAP